MTTETCGPKPLNVFASYDRASRTWKTSQGCFPGLMGTSDEYSETWPNSGTMRNGACYQRKPLEPLISEKGCGSWPTPTTTPGRPNEGNVRMLRAKVLAGELDASEASQMLHGKDVFSAQSTIPKWPTPTKRDWKDSGDCANVPVNCLLGRAVKPSLEHGALNPDWVEWLMGWPRGWTNLEPLDSVVIDPWDADPAEEGRVSRITTVRKNRKNRLECTGNGQVPQCAAAAFDGLMERIK